MILVLDNEVDPDLRYLGPELVRQLPDAEYHVFPEDRLDRPVDDLGGVVFSGSTASVHDPDHQSWMTRQSRLLDRCIDAGVPVLGICFGHQLVNHSLGGSVETDTFRGGFERLIDVSASDELLVGVDPVVPVLHGDVVTEPGDGMEWTASTAYSELFCTRHRSAPVWTVQFHPELTAGIASQLEEFQPGDHSFAETNADVVLENFAAVVDRRAGRWQ